MEKPEKVYVLANQTAVFATVVDGDSKPSVKWYKGRVSLEESNEVKVYYDEREDIHCMEIDNCKPKDAGTYQVTATNEFGSETIPVTLIITQNPEDVVDLKTMLKNRNYGRRGDGSDDPDWGKLKKGSAIEKEGDGEGEKVKLRHVELEKKPAEEVVELTPEAVIS